MVILRSQSINFSKYGKTYTGNAFAVHVKLDDVSQRVSEMVRTFTDQSWIRELDPVSQRSFTARSEATITKLVEQVLANFTGQITEEIGELLVSQSAQEVLVTELGHNPFVLAEIWKEKKTGNPGFDFHTESVTPFIVFGEAKYNSKSNPYTIAIKQIISFIAGKKDEMELKDLRDLGASDDAINNAINGDRAFAAAFSVRGKDPAQIIENAISCESIDGLFPYPELYIIGIEI